MAEHERIPENPGAAPAGPASAWAGQPQAAPQPTIPREVPLLALSESVLFPYMVLPLSITSPALAQVIDAAAVSNKIVGLFARRPRAEGAPPPPLAEIPSIYPVGTAAALVRMVRLPDGTAQVLLQGLARVRFLRVTRTQPVPYVEVYPLEETNASGIEVEGLARHLLHQFERAVQLSPHLPQEAAVAAANTPGPGALADFVAANLNLSLEERQDILETLNVTERLRKVARLLARELEILEIGQRIQAEIKEQMSRAQREYYLREQLKAIQRELGEKDPQQAEIEELRRRIEEAKLPPEAQREAERELDRLASMHPAAPDYAITRTFLDWLASLPWNIATEDHLDIDAAQRILDEDHYDLERVKERILDFLAVRKLKQDIRGPILCFVGPPGVGKTSLGQSIARALGRKFIRISLGGVRDEAEIRGHRRTYIGALPGRIIQALRRAGSKNPVMMLDEVDKLGLDFRGDPAAALLEVLDPAQNHSFVDNYLGVPFDLSQVLFICTANQLDTIPPPLLDRMEVIRIEGYTEAEKIEIARRYLLPRQLNEHGLQPELLTVPDETLRALIRGYTREAGVRNLERELGAICRKVARRVAQGNTEPVVVTPDQLHEFLGPPRYRYDLAEQRDEIGVATGLAWTEAGGDVLFVEASVVPGKGQLTLTGHLGEVMQESARAALTYARSRALELGLDPHFFEQIDVHIHVPAGAIPKDGPSAGITMATALISALTRRPVRRDVGMTGEITLRGKVLPIGGVKEKLLAAHRAGLRTVILPKENERDLEEVPQQVRDELQIMLVTHMDEVLHYALLPKIPVGAAESGVAG